MVDLIRVITLNECLSSYQQMVYAVVGLVRVIVQDITLANNNVENHLLQSPSLLCPQGISAGSRLLFNEPFVFTNENGTLRARSIMN